MGGGVPAGVTTLAGGGAQRLPVAAMGVTLPFPLDLEAVAALCRRYGVRRLDVFGSAVAGDFDPERSDLDLLVEFEDQTPMPYVNAYLGFQAAMEDLTGRKVDVVSDRSIRNPYFRAMVERQRRPVFPPHDIP